MFISKYFLFNPRQWHHLYTGILIILAAFWLPWAFYPCLIVGSWLVIDDIGQHRLQRILGRHYHSFGHYVGKPLYHLRTWLIRRFPSLTWLNRL